MQIKNLASEHRARCIVIDPVSALAKAGNESAAYSVAERLIDWTKGAGITLLCTSLLHEVGIQVEGTPLQISTIADTWIHLNYLVHAGERNRTLSIVKSRGTAHSNQVRELILSSTGVTLADAYTAGGEVVLGTLRWEKERAIRAAQEAAEVAAKHQQTALDSEEAGLEAQLKALQIKLRAKRTEKAVLARQAANRAAERLNGENRMQSLRGVDAA
jgi:circadian clock protein KaiC